MPQNQFLPVATGDGANTLTPAQYAALGVLAQGFQSGILPSVQFNTVLRQLSTVVAAVAQFTADNQSADVLDDGVVSNFESKFYAALKGSLSSSSVHYGTATGTNDAMVVTAVPPLQATTGGGYQPGSFLILKTPGSTNATTAPTVNANSIGNIAITKRGGAPLAVGDIPTSSWIILFFDGTGCFLVSLAASDIIAAFPATALWHTGIDTSGSASAITAAVTPAVGSRQSDFAYLIFPAHACAGATTIDVGFGAQQLYRLDGSALQQGDYAAGQPLVVFDDGTKFRAQTRPSTYYPDNGAVNAPVIATGATALFDGLSFRIKMKYAPTGASVLAISGSLTNIPLQRRGGLAFVGGEYAANDFIDVAYSSTASAFLLCDLTKSDVLSATAPLGSSGVRTYYAAGSYNFTAPVTGWYRFYGWGAGGGGAAGLTGAAGGGGGSGGLGVIFLYLTAGTVVPLVVGAGGAGGNSGGSGGVGGSTSINGVAVASGGSNTTNAVSSGQSTAGGPGGSGLVTTSGYSLPGQAGSFGYALVGLGGQGGSAPGEGGQGSFVTQQSGNAGQAPGGGGGGGYDGNGGPGGDGGVRVEW